MKLKIIYCYFFFNSCMEKKGSNYRYDQKNYSRKLEKFNSIFGI